MLETQKYLRNHPKETALQSLFDEFHIKQKRHKQYPNLVQLCYDQIESPKNHPISRECRGLILDEGYDWHVVSYPYQRFFNVEEGHADKIDWESAKIFEKQDGSLCQMYFYKGSWHVATKQVPDASGETPNDKSITFADLFWRTFYQMGYSLPQHNLLDPAIFCFMFELFTEENRVIVPVEKPQLLLHGVRHLGTLTESDPEWAAKEFGFQLVKKYDFKKLEDVVAFAKTVSPQYGEGFVVVDKNFNRVKVKSPAYVALSQLGGDGFSDRRLLALCQSNESDEVLSYFPKFRDRFNEIQPLYKKAIEETEIVYNNTNLQAPRKDIAISFSKSKFSGILFQLLDKKIQSVTEGFSKYSVESLEKILLSGKK